MRHDNDVHAVTNIRAKAANFVRAHLNSPRRAATYGLLAAVGVGALAMAAGPVAADATAPKTAAATVMTAAKAPAKSTATTKAPTAAKAAAPAPVHRTANKELAVKYQAQPNYYWCGPAATRNALSATGHNVTMANLAKTMGTTEAGTNSAYEITAALNKVSGGNKYRTTELSKATISAKQAADLERDIVATIDDNRAVVANVAGTATDTAGAKHSYEGGHYIAVHGYSNNGHRVKIADSADPNSAHYWINTGDLAKWMATRGYSH